MNLASLFLVCSELSGPPFFYLSSSSLFKVTSSSTWKKKKIFVWKIPTVFRFQVSTLSWFLGKPSMTKYRLFRESIFWMSRSTTSPLGTNRPLSISSLIFFPLWIKLKIIHRHSAQQLLLKLHWWPLSHSRTSVWWPLPRSSSHWRWSPKWTWSLAVWFPSCSRWSRFAVESICRQPRLIFHC